jgi:hypothetical protein
MKRAAFLLLAGLALMALPARAAAPLDADDDKEGTISGMALARPQGGFIGVEIKDGSFRITFYNLKKKPTPADKASAVLRWPVHYQPNDERTLLTPGGDPSVLSSAYPVKPPHTFKLHISLLASDPTVEPEGYVVDFSSE